ncbi:MAG TPA: fused response regulator/phosphatase [Thiobacillaceae bacterium]|nr:fused response regulator/phosphatase [Thiobacillaceae bacterium]HNU64811.1 fused response regulator/phosphatase [Thiobacillaceae bacterium]
MTAPSLKILVVADGHAAAALLPFLLDPLRELGHEPFVVTDGHAVMRQFQEVGPDLVLMGSHSLALRDADTLRAMRAGPEMGWVPVLVYAASEHMADILHGLERGADDYLYVPCAPQLLQAKMCCHARLLDLRRQAREHARELEGWHLRAQEQNRLAAHVMARLTQAAGLQDAMLRYFNIPAETFSGDLLCAARTPGGTLHVMLADAAGHGLPAALSAMPLTQTFYGMTDKGFPVSSIVVELNRRLQAILPRDRFVAASLAAIDVRRQSVEIWNGGNPDALFIDTHGHVLARWVSRHPPLGILSGERFSGRTETLACTQAGDLLLCSDGLVEAEDPSGNRLGQDAVVRLLGMHAGGEARFEGLRDGVQTHLQAGHGRDDISCMLVHVPIERRRRTRWAAPGSASPTGMQDWRMELLYSAQELRYLDVVPGVLACMTQLHPLRPHQSALFVVVSELFNNALDHGLLALDSRVKAQPDGFETYLRQRGERLAALREGHIRLGLHMHQEGGRNVLDISVQDSGPGFDHARSGNALEPRAEEGDPGRPHGRGIALVRGLCEWVEYVGRGNRVRARYTLGVLADGTVRR